LSSKLEIPKVRTSVTWSEQNCSLGPLCGQYVRTLGTWLPEDRSMKMHFHMSLHLTGDVNIPDNNMILLITQSILTAWLNLLRSVSWNCLYGSERAEPNFFCFMATDSVTDTIRLLYQSNNTSKQVKFAEIKNYLKNLKRKQLRGNVSLKHDNISRFRHDNIIWNSLYKGRRRTQFMYKRAFVNKQRVL
jgi:hypothetical protein